MVDFMIMVERTIQRLANKHVRTNLVFSWSIITIKDVRVTFHCNF